MRRGITRWAAVSLAAFAALALASAGTVATAAAADRDQTPTMLAIASAEMGPGNCAGNVSVTWTAEGALDGPDAPDGLAIGRGGGCQIWLDGPRFDRTGWPWACSLVAHEYGHAALNLDHSDDPASLMAARMTAVWAPCASAWPGRALLDRAVHLDSLVLRYERRSDRLLIASWRARRRGNRTQARGLLRRSAACERVSERLRDEADALASAACPTC